MKYVLWIGLVFVLLLRLLAFKQPYLDGQKIRIRSFVSSEPIKYSDSQLIRLYELKIYLPLYPEINYGDYIEVEGVVNENELKDPVVREIRETRGLLYNVREKLLESIKIALPEPHASLVAGVTLGIKSGIPQDFSDILKKTGTAHVVVASGMNVTLVAGFLVNALTLVFSRKKAIPLAVFGIWVYALISGFDAPIIRAAIMGSFAFIAQRVGRVVFAWKGLIFSALIMLIINPGWIRDIGFILSFTATASILYFEPKIRKRISFLPKIIRENFSTSLSAQIAVSPIIYLTFGQFNIFSPLINTLIAPVIAPMTIIAGMGSLVSIIIPGFGKLIILLVYPLTSYFIWVVKLFT